MSYDLEHFRVRIETAIRETEGLNWASFMVRRDELIALEELMRDRMPFFSCRRFGWRLWVKFGKSRWYGLP